MADPLVPPRGEEPPKPDRLSRDTRSKVNRLQARASRGLWAMAAFVAISIAALRDFSFLPPLPQRILELLGSSPPTELISAALIVYTFSAIVLILSRMATGSGDYSGFAHVGYLTAFYVFYHFAAALRENFWAVFAAGMTILMLESYHIWTHYRELVRELEKILPRLDGGK